jgi:diaminohydroxyphosphoribosylaminopyrimidine deaminase/5-amino-6-(5-phosphoribosylamino)uracil reductase
LIQAGVTRIVVAIEDPNPLVSGQGIARLRAAGITVDVGLMADAAYDINIGFFSRMTRQRPWVRVKAACSLDGRTALANGQSQWITGEAARADGHRWRKRAGAVLTGIGTVLADNPRLDVRHVPTARQPQPVVLDSRLRTPPNAHCVTRGPENGALIYTLQSVGSPSPYPASTEIITTAAQDNRVAIGPVLHDLARRGVNELHVEAGAALNAALLAGQWVDEWLIYMAPSLLGAGRGMLEGFSLTQLPTRPPLQFKSVEHLGDDLRLLVRPCAS